MFYLTMHSTYFIYCYMEGRRKYFIYDALNTFLIRLYGGRLLDGVGNNYGEGPLIAREKTHCCHYMGYSF